MIPHPKTGQNEQQLGLAPQTNKERRTKVRDYAQVLMTPEERNTLRDHIMDTYSEGTTQAMTHTTATLAVSALIMLLSIVQNYADNQIFDTGRLDRDPRRV